MLLHFIDTKINESRQAPWGGLFTLFRKSALDGGRRRRSGFMVPAREIVIEADIAN